jgi:Ca2+-binding EF-hand superfamily protein
MEDTGALTQSEIDGIRAAFEKFDVDRSGSIDAWELKSTLEAMGQRPTDEEVFALLAECDEDGSGQIDFSEFLRVIAKQKQATSKNTVDQDIYEAFISMGGNPDKTYYNHCTHCTHFNHCNYTSFTHLTLHITVCVWVGAVDT